MIKENEGTGLIPGSGSRNCREESRRKFEKRKRDRVEFFCERHASDICLGNIYFIIEIGLTLVRLIVGYLSREVKPR